MPGNPTTSESSRQVRKRRNALRVVGTIVGALLTLFAVIYLRFVRYASESVSKESALVSLAGVPVYPGAQFDDEETRKQQAFPKAIGKYDPLRTVVAFRSGADPTKAVLPFYETTLGSYGFRKTRLGGGPGLIAGASYVNGPTSVIIQILPSRDDGPPILLLTRSDGDNKILLGRQSNTVMPEDFSTAHDHPAKKARSTG